MIISVNPKPSIEEFKRLMEKTDRFLNDDAVRRQSYYAKRCGHPLEDDVKEALSVCAVGTSFQGTIEKISGQRFPDIIASKLYGVEVKSTKEDHWTSTGSSILESTRVKDVERIYMTFGKLGGNPIEFRSKPYEQCLSGIAVTHMPRYLIDMRLEKGETIFDEMGIEYDDLRQMKNPVTPVANYYRKKLKPGERLWWTGDPEQEIVPPTIRLWKNLNSNEKIEYIVYACVNYPEVFGGNYENYALWLTSRGVVDPHIRDQFSAGGQEKMQLSNGETVKFPGVYRRLKNYADYFFRRLRQLDPRAYTIERSILDDENLRIRYMKWADRVSRYTTMKYEISMDALETFFDQTI
ncbi:MAG: hypothetical protein IJ860_08720 [Eubacterium sp.]|nr:hypothetical protein [Eubacterium sp.]